MKQRCNSNEYINRKPRIIIDMDDVIVDYIGILIQDFNVKYGTSYSIEDCTSWYLEDIFGENINEFIYFTGRFNDLPIKNNAVSHIKNIIDSGRYDVFIVTACKPQGFMEKYNWVKKYMPFFIKDRLIPCSEKSAIWGDVIVDDKIANIDDFVKNSPLKEVNGIVVDMPHNRMDNTYIRIKDLSNLLNILDDIYYPKIKEE